MEATWRQAITATTEQLSDLPPHRLGTSVPTCPGWDVERLLRHLARVQGWVTGVLATDVGATPPDAPRPDDGEPIVVFVARTGAALVARLDATDPDRLVPGFTGTVPARFWLRRMAHETTLHGWDALEALEPGSAHPLDTDLAIDGVDELLDVFVPLRFDLDGFGPTGESMHLHATDGPGEWLVRFPAGAPVTVERAHAKGDVAVRAPADDLLLALWGRVGADRLEVLGDADVLARYQAAARY